MGRLEKQLDPDEGPLARLASDLRRLRQSAGSPTYREMSTKAGYSPSALSAAASGASLPSAGVLTAYVKACGGDVEHWQVRRTAVNAQLVTGYQATVYVSKGEVPKSGEELSRSLPSRPRGRFTRQAAGLMAAVALGSLATIIPISIWGAPSCMTPGHNRPTTSATCPMRQ